MRVQHPSCDFADGGAGCQFHLALYIGFLEVLKPAQADLNRMTQRHLDFFYRQVLQLPARAAQPDRAHLLFELAKFQQEYALKADIRFKAGKDATGVALFYRLDQDGVIDKAQVVRLRSLFLNTRPSGTDNPPTIITGLYTSAIANSADGNGADFAKDQAVKAWLPFGDTSRDRAQMGLAIASPLLLLQAGDRTITFQFTLSALKANAQAPADKLPELFKVSFQTKWDGDILILTVNLTADVEPVVPYHSDLSGAALTTDQPVARFELQDQLAPQQSEDTFTSAYHYFQGVKVSQITITTEVKEVRNLVLCQT